MSEKIDWEAIKARAEKATPAPWHTSSYYHSDVAAGNRLICECKPVNCPQPIIDAEFIADARSDIPALIREVERLQQVNRDIDDVRIHAEAELEAAREKMGPLQQELAMWRDAHCERVREAQEDTQEIATLRRVGEEMAKILSQLVDRQSHRSADAVLTSWSDLAPVARKEL